MNDSQAIDAVIAWVDGEDPEHIARINEALVALGKTPRSAASTRFASRGEIYHCLRSIGRFAPFFRRIHIVTDNQRPALEQYGIAGELLDKIGIVDHRQIFAGFEQYLPTFNSRSIEVMLHRIPGLSDRYVYFNDDMSLIRPVRPEDFFGPKGPVLRGHWAVMPQYRIKRRLQRLLSERFGVQFDTHQHYSFKLSQAKAAQHAGFDRRFYLLGHYPQPLRRSTYERFFAAHPEVREINLQDKFRTDRQFNVAALAYHLELAAGAGHPQVRRNLLYIKPKDRFQLGRMLRHAENDARTLFCCVQSLDLFPEKDQDRIWHWLQSRLEVTHAGV
jgi:hypothetical protein